MLDTVKELSPLRYNVRKVNFIQYEIEQHGHEGPAKVVLIVRSHGFAQEIADLLNALSNEAYRMGCDRAEKSFQAGFNAGKAEAEAERAKQSKGVFVKIPGKR